MKGRIARIGFLAVVTAAVVFPAPAPAQDDSTTASAREGRRRGQRSGARQGAGQFTTATFEQMWDRTMKPDYEAAGIAPEKIEQLKQLEMEGRSAFARGERPDFKALNQKRRQILTREELQKLMDIRRQRREGDLRQVDARATVTAEVETTGTQTSNGPGTAQNGSK